MRSGTRPAEVQSFLEENRQWLERAQLEMEAQYPQRQRGLPDRVELLAIGREWRLDYVYDSAVRPRRRVFDDRLELTLPRANHRSAWQMR